MRKPEIVDEKMKRKKKDPVQMKLTRHRMGEYLETAKEFGEELSLDGCPILRRVPKRQQGVGDAWGGVGWGER